MRAPSFANARAVARSELLFGDLVPYIGRTTKQLDAFSLANPEEANYVQIHETYFVQVRRDPWSTVLHLRKLLIF